MLSSEVAQIGIDGPTMHAEDTQNGHATMKGQMDLWKALAIIGAFYWVIMTVVIVPTAVIATFITVMVPALLIRCV